MSALVPARTALLLMDFQNGIVAMLGDQAPALLERAGRAREAARQAGIAVMYVRVAFTEVDAAAVPAHNPMLAAAAASGRLADGSDGTSIHPALAPDADEEVFRKCRVGAFSTTNLAARLAARGIDTLVLAGISTSGVVLSTLRDAADHDYRLFVLSDCCGDPDAEVHRVLTEKVFPRQAQVVGLDAFVAMAAG